MYKYIQDSIKNNSRSVLKDLTKPQRKAMSEIIRGLFTAGKPILRHIAQDKNISAKKQAEKYSHHLGNVDIAEKIDALALKKAKITVRKTTIIAYDLTDISKSAKKMEKISRIFDGSKRKTADGFLLHGVGINGILTKLKVHDGENFFLNDIRKKIVTDIAQKLNFKGIWVVDRGNDDKQFFKFLRQDLKVNFIARLRGNRQVVTKKTGVKIQVKNLTPGKYAVYLMKKNNDHVDLSSEYTLIISHHLKDKAPIRLLHSLKYSYSKKQIITMYLQRWGVENIFKRIKEKFELEKIRVLKYKKFVNFVALIQLAVLVSTITFFAIQQTTNRLIFGVLIHYKNFIKQKTLGFNIDSFITFMKNSLKPLVFRLEKPPNQLNIFSQQQLDRLDT